MSKDIQIKIRNQEGQYDDLFPKTKVGLVEGLEGELNNKVDKVDGKQLSTEDYTSEEKTKLAGIEEGAKNYVHPDTHSAEMIDETEEKNFVSNTEKDAWNQKQDELGFTPEDVTKKGQAGGYASLDSNAKIPLNQLPDGAKSQTFIVTDSTDRLELEGLLPGDRAYETDTGDSYIYDGSDWHIQSKADWENVNLQWGNITDGPESSTEDIDDSVAKTHEHNNRDTLDKIGATGEESSFDLSSFVTRQDLDNEGFGDMVRSIYDTNNSGVVDEAESAPWSGITGKPETFTPSEHGHDAEAIIENNNKMFVSNTEKAEWDEKAKIVLHATNPGNADIWYQEI